MSRFGLCLILFCCPDVSIVFSSASAHGVSGRMHNFKYLLSVLLMKQTSILVIITGVGGLPHEKIRDGCRLAEGYKSKIPGPLRMSYAQIASSDCFLLAFNSNFPMIIPNLFIREFTPGRGVGLINIRITVTTPTSNDELVIL